MIEELLVKFQELQISIRLLHPTVGQNLNHAAKNQKIDFFSFRLKLIPHYSKLFVDLSMYNVFVLR